MAEIRTYTQEFKDSAVQMVKEQRMSIPKAAEGLGIPPNTLRGWIESADGKRQFKSWSAGSTISGSLKTRTATS